MIFYYEKGKSLREIGQIVNKSHAIVQYVIKKYKNDMDIENNRGKHLQKIFNTREERWVFQKKKGVEYQERPL